MAATANTTNLPSLNRAQIMRDAWAMFRQKYGFRGAGMGIPFLSIGRNCLHWCMREAWRLAKEAARIAAIPAAVKAERIAHLRDQIERLEYLPFGMRVAPRRAALEAEIQSLVA